MQIPKHTFKFNLNLKKANFDIKNKTSSAAARAALLIFAKIIL